MEDTEIEIKVKADNVAKLVQFLEKQGSFTGESHQKDDYFTPANRDFMAEIPVAEWFRIRDGSTGKLTYKRWHYDESGRSDHADEYETAVEDTAQFRKILDALNFRYLVTVDKMRKTWDYQDYEIAVDSVKNLGDFVEVEYKGQDTVIPKAVIADMIAFLKTAGCTNIQRSFSGYPYAILHPDEQEFETV